MKENQIQAKQNNDRACQSVILALCRLILFFPQQFKMCLGTYFKEYT